MKKYIAPVTEIITVETQQMIAESLGIYEEETEQTLSRDFVDFLGDKEF